MVNNENFINFVKEITRCNQEGYVTCDKCKGDGCFPLYGSYEVEYCTKCKGMGYLTWLEQLFGKQTLSEEESVIRSRKADNFWMDKRRRGEL